MSTGTVTRRPPIPQASKSPNRREITPFLLPRAQRQGTFLLFKDEFNRIQGGTFAGYPLERTPSNLRSSSTKYRPAC